MAIIYSLVGLRMAFWAAHMYRPGVLTRDLGGTAGTDAFTAAVIDRL